MASHLKIEGNQGNCYCSVHQGADIARGKLEKVIHPYPRQHAHTWPLAPCHCLWVLYSVFVWVGAPLEPSTFTSGSRGENVEVLTLCCRMLSVTSRTGGCVIVITEV